MHLKTLTPERQVSESGLRYYGPTLGRWCSRDPLEHERGGSLYVFAGNAAVGSVDGLGLKEYYVVLPLGNSMTVKKTSVTRGY